MPFKKINGVTYHYNEWGSGEETIVFSHGLLFSGEMFARQVETLKDHYRIITYDHRGQGQTEVSRSGYDMDTLADDAKELIHELGAAPCHFVGLSMGGFVGLRLAIHYPHLLKSLILMETSADPEEEKNRPKYNLLSLIARWLSLKLVSGRVMPIMFGETFLNDPNRAEERKRWQRYMESNDPVGIYRATQGVIKRKGVADKLHEITVPTLILVGEEDVATVPEKAERMHKGIRGSQIVYIPNAGHTCTISQPEKVTRVIDDFLSTITCRKVRHG